MPSPEKMPNVFSALLIVTGLFFSFPLQAAESIPATETIQSVWICTPQNNTYTTKGALLTWQNTNLGPTAETTRLSAKQACVDILARPTINYDSSTYQLTNTTQNDIDNYITAGWTRTTGTSSFSFANATLGIVAWTENYTVYSCPNPDYPNLVGTICEADAEPYCGFDNPVFTSASQTMYPTLCVAMNDGVSYCEYEATTESNGQTNGFTYTPSSESCGCTLGAVPCVNESDSATTDTPDAQGCIQTGGVNWCPADPQDRCTDAGGYTVCETNCGYIGDTFYCGDTTLPDASACTTGDTRLECTGLLEGECPPGYDCSGTQAPDTSPCTTGDTRPECSGVADGGQPNLSSEYITQQMQDYSGILNQIAGNTNRTANNTQTIADSLTTTVDPDAQIQSTKDSLTAQLTAADNEAVNNVSTATDNEGLLATTYNNLYTYLSGFVTSLVPSPAQSCSPYVMSWPEQITIDICTEAEYIKIVFAWLLNILLGIYAFNAVVTRSSPEVK